MSAATQIAGLARAAQKAYFRKWTFLALFLIAFFASFSALSALDIVPEPSADDAAAPTVTLSASPLVAAAAATLPAVREGELPEKIEIPSIKLSVQVANPASASIEALDRALLAGAVRYPTSGKLGADGNVVIFGHSSYLPIVNNLAYKAFDGIQNLKAGDAITVYSADRAYEYRVDAVTKANAESAAIPLSVSGQKLTLSTCDSFGKKSDRFVVTATLVDSHLTGA